MNNLGKNILFLAITIGLIACGGGTTDDDTQKDTSQIDTSTPININTPSDTNSSTNTSVSTSDSSDITEYLKAINDARSVEQNCGTAGIKPAVGDVIWNTTLASVALEHSLDLATWSHNVTEESIAIKRFTHEGSGTSSDITAIALNLTKGSTVSERIEHAGYKYLLHGENLSAGTSRDTAVEVIQTWIDSPPHCVILMKADFTEVGMARVEDSNSFYINYWTQNFGKPQ